MPNSLTKLECSHTLITLLDNLPNSLTELNCRNTNITSLDNLPSRIELICVKSKIDLEKLRIKHPNLKIN